MWLAPGCRCLDLRHSPISGRLYTGRMTTFLLDEDRVPDETLDATIELGHAIETALDRAISPLTDDQVEALIEKIRIWQASGGVVEAVRLSTEPQPVSNFCQGMGAFLANIASDHNYSADQEDDVDRMAERVLLALIEGGWGSPPEAFGDNTIFSKSQAIDIERLRAASEQAQMQQATAPANKTGTGRLRL